MNASQGEIVEPVHKMNLHCRIQQCKLNTEISDKFDEPVYKVNNDMFTLKLTSKM